MKFEKKNYDNFDQKIRGITLGQYAVPYFY